MDTVFYIDAEKIVESLQRGVAAKHMTCPQPVPNAFGSKPLVDALLNLEREDPEGTESAITLWMNSVLTNQQLR